MNITDVEKAVGLNKSNIKFYQSEGLIAPGKNPETGKIDFSPEDIAALKKIKILRVAGVPLKEVKSLILSNKSLMDALNETEQVLNEEIIILEEKKALCDSIRLREEAFHDMNLEAYDLEAQLPHNDLKQINATDKVLRAKFIDFLAALFGILIALTYIIVPTYFVLSKSESSLPWWLIVIGAIFEIACILTLLTGNKKKKRIPKK
jgi:DNA-binding transcriptional MerR regulator